MKSAIEIPMVLKMEAKVRKYENYKVSANTDSHDVTKNLTDHRMHIEGPQIYQIFHFEIRRFLGINWQY